MMVTCIIADSSKIFWITKMNKSVNTWHQLFPAIFLQTNKGLSIKEVRLYLGEVGSRKKPQKIRTSIVIFNEISLFKPDRRWRGSENPYFCRTDFMDGPYSISKPCTSENILFFSDRNWWLLHPNKKNWSNWVHFGPISKLLLSPNSFYRLLLFFHFA